MGYRALACLAAAVGAIPAQAQLGRISASATPPAEIASRPALSIERAWQNYTAIVGGFRQLSQLSPIELQEVALLDRDIRARSDRRSQREKCLDGELDRLGVAPTALAIRSIDLKCSQR